MLTEEQIQEIEDGGIIYHLQNGRHCLTPCPYRDDRSVGSVWCQICKYHITHKAVVDVDSTVLYVLCEKKKATNK